MAKVITRAKISERALVARINRKLVNDYMQVKKCRADSRWNNELGEYYIVDFNHNTIRRKHVHLENFAREVEVLANWEELDSSSI